MSTRPPIPQGRPPAYAFVGRMYRRSLRPVILACSCISALWTLVWGISELRSINIDKSSTVSSLATFDIVLGALYLATFAIECFGIFAAVTQRIPLVRIFALLSVIGALLVFGANVLTIVLDFLFKKRLISECVSALTGQTFIERGWWGTTEETLTQDDANTVCNRLYNHDVFADFAWLFAATILSLMFASVAWAFYRQLLDPASMAYPRAPSNQFRMNAYAPPPGPPPQQMPDYVPPYDPHKLPNYENDGERELGPEKAPQGYGVSDETTNPFERRAEDV